jgi:hypothetical protein
MSYNNYGRKGGGNYQPKPRPVLPPEHQLQPQAEAAILDKADLKNYARKGNQPVTETTVLNSDPSRKNIMVAQACLMAFNQCGIPLDNAAFPAIGKFDTRYDANHYYLKYEGPIPWIHDKAWRHVPCFTRYVIDMFGRVLNAHNGLTVKIGDWETYELVPDGPSNKTTRVKLADLMILAFCPLPADFKDYGFKNYSHKFEINPATGQMQWMPLPKVKCKDNSNGMVEEFQNLQELVKCKVKDFNQMKEWSDYLRNGLKGETVTIGDLVVKESEPAKELPVVPVLDVKPQEVSAPAAPHDNFDSGSQPAEHDFDADFSF